MSYPTLEQYNEAFQYPQSSLSDPDLKRGTITTTGLGLPLALCGGFALTYTISTGQTKYAVRCFHKKSNALEKRYSAISAQLKSLNSPYFLDFEFQPQGVRVNGNTFPIVKMLWASGNTLGEFLERQYKNKIEINQLTASLRGLSTYLEGKHLAHGDVQPGNVMVFNGGRSIQMIDYDGMFVDDLRTIGSAELGHRNFQHPGRTGSDWNYRLDRFSFISLNVALRVLEQHPDLWNKTHSDGDAILFKANDFADPARSTIFNDLFGRPQCAGIAQNFAAICKSPFDQIPTLEDFLAGRNIPQVVISVSQTAAVAAIRYMSAFSVLDANDYARCFQYVGDRIELIGKIVEVKPNKARNGKPYIFINFGPWRGKIVKISIWSEGLAVLPNHPGKSWVGKWISVVGLLEPPYVSKKYNYTHLSISITQANQLHIITESEAKFRLAGSSTRATGLKTEGTNKMIIEGIRDYKRVPSHTSPTGQVSTSRNQAIINIMKGSRPTPIPAHKNNSTGYRSSKPIESPAKKSDNCFIATAVYGATAQETNQLRFWRDKRLMPTAFGRAFVSCYYVLSPYVASILERNKWSASIVRTALDWFILRL